MSDAAHRALLDRLAGRLAEEGFESRLLAADGEEVPFHTLLVALGGEGDDEPDWRLEASFVPGMEEQLEGSSLLQLFVALTDEVAATVELGRFCLLLNAQLPLIGFGSADLTAAACFRHVAMLPEEPETAVEVAVQAVWMTSYLLDLFAAAVTAVARGEKTIPQALAGSPYAGLFV